MPEYNLSNQLIKQTKENAMLQKFAVIVSLFLLNSHGSYALELRPSTAFTPRYCQAGELGNVNGNSFNGTVSFTNAEKQLHNEKISSAVEIAKSCARSALDYQQEFGAVPEHFGFSPYYGANNQSDLAELLQFAEPQMSFSEISTLKERMIPVSCVGVALKCLEKGFVESDLEEIWTKVHKFRCANRTRGIAVQHALRQLGWKTLYWNNGDLPKNNLKEVGNNDYSYGILNLAVDDENGFPNTKTTVPQSLKSIPFGFGTAEDGYHVFIASTDSNGQFVTIEGSVGNEPVKLADVESEAPSGAFYQNPIGKLGVMNDYTDGIIAIPPIN